MLDANGEVVHVQELLPDLNLLQATVPRRDGTFALCTTTDAAETIVFVRGAEELRRAPFDAFGSPPAGGTLVLRY